MNNHIINRISFGFIAAFLAVISMTNPALAGAISDNTLSVSGIMQNMVWSIERVPGLITGMSYLAAILFGVIGIFKLRDHVENPSQTSVKSPIIYFLIGGAFVSLPIIYEAILVSFDGGERDTFDPNMVSYGGLVFGWLGSFSSYLEVGTPDLNGILANITAAISDFPGLVSAISYILGLLIGIQALIKIKEHVENPDQTPIREALIRLFVGAALFGLPTLFTAMLTMINGGEGVGGWGQTQSILNTFSWFSSEYASNNPISPNKFCNPMSGTLGATLCQTILHTAFLPAFLSGLAYFFGLVLGVWGVFKLRDHVLNPQQTQIWEGYSRLLAGGLFFALPVTVEAIRASVTPVSLTVISSTVGGGVGFGTRFFGNGSGAGVGGTITGYNEVACGGGFTGGASQIFGGIANLFGRGGDTSGGIGLGLDQMMACMMGDLIGPMHSLLNFFAFSAGIILIMIGISRMTKSAQDGARGPGGMGTLMTFVAGGALISYNEFIRGFTGTFFTNPTTMTYANIGYLEEGSNEAMQSTTVISAMLKFMIIVGLISFIRGIFIVRSVAEGDNQASIMAGLTHLVGGALAVNLGPLLNVVQSTLGISGYGITFG